MTTVTVTWVAPATGSVDNYDVTVDQGGTVAAITAGQVTTTLSNLKAGTEFTVTITSTLGTRKSTTVSKKVKTRELSFFCFLSTTYRVEYSKKVH
jgi:hypothetical protein